ncbi:uncharacterized protein [Argopecten irradians]|uniref:uncharacterized protein isoform X3 n=1 Tax=Argopecten irradians TaxID=31199 RepID=UPI003710A44A
MSSASSSMETTTTTTNRGIERREDMAFAATAASERVDPRRVASIDDDDFAEYDVTEHKELSLGIPERFVPVAQRSGPIYYEPGDEDQDSDEDEVLDFTTPKHLGQTEGTDSQGS